MKVFDRLMQFGGAGRFFRWGLALFLAVVGATMGWADGTNVISITFPSEMPLLVGGADPAFSSNNLTAYQQGGGSAALNSKNGTLQYPVATNVSGQNILYALASSDFGQNIEHDKPDSYLGDPLKSPSVSSGSVIDWTFMASNGIPDTNLAYYVASVPAVYAAAGGVLYLNWRIVDTNNVATTSQVTYVVANTSTGRPYRIYWTDDPYNAPPVSLQGKFFKIHYTVDCPAAVYQVTTNASGAVLSNVLYGIYVDDSDNLRVAVTDDHRVEGMFLLQYFKTGAYKDQIGVIVVEVLEPDVATVDADIGSPIWPMSAGYDTAGLQPKITKSSDGGNTTYVYQQSGGPKDGWVFPVASSVAQPWNIEIYWESPDLMGTYWPFEVDWYSADWPDEPQRYVRGEGSGGDYGANVYVPSSMVATVMSYQEPPGHGVIVSNSIFMTTTNNGQCLLQLSTSDDIWFVPVRSVARTYSRFNLNLRDWTIGSEISPYESAWSLGFPYAQSCLKTESIKLGDSFSVDGWFFTPNLAVMTTGELIVYDQNMDQSGAFHEYNTIFRLQITSTGDADSPSSLNGYMCNGESTSYVVADTFSEPLASFTWYHYAFCYDDSEKEARLYVNGSLRDTEYVTKIRLSASKPLYVGKQSNATTATNAIKNIAVDELRIWDVALGDTEVSAIYNGELKDRNVDDLKSAGLQAYWPIRPEDVIPQAGAEFQMADWVNGVIATACSNAVMLPGGAVGLQVLDGYSKLHGYIYRPFGTDYNADLYVEASSSAPNNNTYIFGVQTNSPLEVWWGQEVQQEDMPDPLHIPAQVQRYKNTWPESPPELVLASFAGSSAGNVDETGCAISIDGDRGNYVELQPGVYFSGDFTVEGWVFVREFTAYAPMLEFGNGYRTNSVTLGLSQGSDCKPYLEISDAEGHVTTAYGTQAIPTGQWVHVAATYSAGEATLYINSSSAGSQMNMLAAADVTRYVNFIGHSLREDATHPPMNGSLDEIHIWDYALSQDDIINNMYENYELAASSGLVLDLPFDEGRGALTRDVVSGKYAWFRRAVWTTPGAPKVERLVYASAENPSIYYRNDSTAYGFNPNEEHAFVSQYAGGQTVFALRDDLNRAGVSPPYVLVNVQDPLTGYWGMDVFKVVRTNEVFTEFKLSMTAGTVQPGPVPLTLLPNHWNAETICDQGPGWQDRKLAWWAVSATSTNDWTYLTNQIPGYMVMRNYYPMQSSFWFPKLGSNAQPAVQTSIPWLYDTQTNFWKVTDYPTKFKPIPVYWTVDWLTNAPEMNIGQTLTDATDGLPEIWNQNSVDVLYDQSKHRSGYASVALYDPVQAQAMTLGYSLEEYGLEPGGKDAKVYNRNGRYYFNGLPPDMSDRLYIDPALTENNIRFEGELVEGLTSTYLLINAMNSRQRDAMCGIVVPDREAELTDAQKDWINLSDQLALSLVYVQTNTPYENMALTALGQGTGYVTLVMNNATDPATGVSPSDPITMTVLRVGTNMEVGVVIPLEDQYNTLSDQMTMLHSLDFAGTEQHFEYDWRWQSPNADGTTPTDPSASLAYLQATGANAVVIGGDSATLDDMVNRFFAVRYRAVTEVSQQICGTNWSPFTAFALSEGWVQRVLNALTPFEQRMRDLSNNEVERDQSMIVQAGPPYEGDVALTMDNVENVGLIQLYQTVLNRAIALSLDQGIDSIDANQQLMLAATRLNDLYMMLGNEAYGDAQDPTIGFGSTQTPATGGSLDYGRLSSSLFCFDNQLATLLEEELCLLRGTGSTNLSPGVGVSPVYNRLWWNFTKGITAGEVAYAVNYNIVGISNAIIDATTAKAMYPQGHGDAWGYYLDALWGYYRLMQYTNFSWGVPSITPMLMNDLTIDADYYDEAKFAQAAASMARTGKDVVNRTYRKAYVEQPEGKLFPGYFDSKPDRAWGAGEWACRAGMGSFYNWVAANSLLPIPTQWTTNATSDYDEEGITKIDRSTVPALNEIAATARTIQRELDNVDQGLNPLGLSRNAVPFDISPAALDSGDSHFEQIEGRAERALLNARAMFDAAAEAGKMLRQQDESSYNFEMADIAQERSYKQQLIEIYGYPYSDDIGAGCTYPQDYDGPDLYHYMYVDMEALGWSGTEVEPVTVYSLEFEWNNKNSELLTLGFATNAPPGEEETGLTNVLSFTWAENGLPVIPSDWTGQRRAQGKLQTAWSDYLKAFLTYQKALEVYENKCTIVKNAVDYYTETWYGNKNTIKGEEEALAAYKMTMNTLFLTAEFAEGVAHILAEVTEEAVNDAVAALPTSTIAGLAAGGDVFSAVRAALEVEKTAAKTANAWATLFKKQWKEGVKYVGEMMELGIAIDKADWEFNNENHEQKLELEEKTRAVNEALYDLKSAFEGVNAAFYNYQTILAEGQRLLQEREYNRGAGSQGVALARYYDMAFRIWRSDLLQKYASSFELAAMYTYLAAKAYDYETAMLSTEAVNDPGSEFLASVVKARTLGQISADGVPLVGGNNGDPGLADILARMKANWQVLDGRLGFNNPECETSAMSLRTELFRILPGAEGDENWRQALQQCMVDDLFENEIFRRYCLPFDSQTGLRSKEPGLIIPFSTTIDFGRNFFDKPLAGGDHSFDSSHFATKIRSVGIWFSNYNANVSSSGSGLSETPRVYLVPAGLDAQRSPTASSGAVRYWSVLDQAIPVPYALDADDLENTDFIPLFDSLSGSLAAIRRYPSLRAYHDSGSAGAAEMNTSSRLVGRSVWNTQWYLIIPAGTLNNNRVLALEAFINGVHLDGNGVKDVRILFETYSNAGN